MKSSRRKLEEFLWITGLHAPARNLFATTVGREAAHARNKMRAFYGELLEPQALVFDIGANTGVMSATFASLGAKVIAVEPNADCVRHIQLAYADKKIEVIQAAAGARNGLATLSVSDKRDATSTLSSEWMSAISQHDESYRGGWSRQISVPVITLDALIAHYGMPYFIKIDVEGFEEQVLTGLSAQPQILSFEFHVAFRSATQRCLEMSLFAEDSTYNVVRNAPWGYPAEFALERWVDKEEIKQLLLNLKGADDQGDIFVKAPKAHIRS